ncbi:hypothetical protein DUI87_01030 [Hirundo rustica rustica]|uniref:Reverse transcriptase RNase H-like domain-containing protein n=1 Tax=Hirundo rustica rustica TaxID=333673 RepID=A0A3M0L856_HIRRU|nr:hypothetical protein DUI87_01030 [Hirundo rustica rustica]
MNEVESEGEGEKANLLPLREIPTAPGIIGYVNVPINTSDVRAFKKEMGKLMDDPLGVSERLDEFLGTSIYSYEDLTAILRSLFNTEEREMIRQAGIREWERRNPQSTPGDQKWPSQDPRWNAQTEEGRRSMIDMRNIIIQGIREAVPRGQNLRAKGEPFKVPIVKNVEIESENKICLGDMLLVEEADYNLLGRDLIVALGINLIVRNSQIMVSIYKLTCEDEDKINLKAIVAVALLVEEAKKITFKAPIVVYTPHNVRTILQQKAEKWLTDARLLKYEAILIHAPELELRTTQASNPAGFLYGEALGKPMHNCSDLIELQTKVREDLEDEELDEGEKWFVDGSARVIEGKENQEKGVAHGVLVQEWGRVKRPVAYLSKMLDPVSHGWPVCIQAIAATAILVEESHKLTFGGKLIVCTPDAVRNVLNQKAEKWLTDSRMLKYDAILIDSDDLTLEVNRSLNPAQFLYGEPADNLIHNCLEIIQYQTKVRGDLEEQALSEGEIIYVDGSSRCLQGKRMSGYAVVDGKNMQTIEKENYLQTGQLKLVNYML